MYGNKVNNGISENCEFLASGKLVRDAISCLTVRQSEKKPLLFIVAYWGQGIEGELDESKEYNILCDLTGGGTNPFIIETLRKRVNVNIKHRSGLHAKVVISENEAVLSSANMSSNGLSLNGNGNIEAGVRIPKGKQLEAIKDWGRDLWSDSEEVSDDMIESAKINYSKRLVYSSSSLMEEASLGAIKSERLFVHGDLFLPGGPKKNNNLESASKTLQKYHSSMDKDYASNHRGKICLFVAHLLWIFDGNSMDTKVGRFEKMADVVLRWRTEKSIKDHEIEKFILYLSQNDKKGSIGKACSTIIKSDWQNITL
jgi:hypothetical protein